jgi:DNA-binding transcriptional MocR family regulator
LATLLGSWQSRSRPAYQDLADAVRTLVVDSRLGVHCRLPAERILAQALGVSRTTVAAAYESLRAEGFLVSRRGAGSWTALPTVSGALEPTRFAAGVEVVTGATSTVLDLAVASIPAPPDHLLAAVEEATADLQRYLGANTYDARGLIGLRRAIADRYEARGLPTTPDQILITNGAQHAWDLSLRLLVGPGDRVVVEQPSYPVALDAIGRNGGRVVPVGMLPDRWNIEVLEATFHQSAPRLAFLMPDFQNPTALVMPDDDRAAVARMARRFDGHVAIDETAVDLLLDPEMQMPGPFARHDRDGRVLTIGSLSKSVWGGLRVGWVRATAPMVHRLAAVRASNDMASPVLEQLLALRLLDRLDEILALRRSELILQRDALVAELRFACPQWKFTLPRGGLSLWIELEAPISSRLVALAAGEGVRLASGPRFGMDGTLERFLRLPFSLPVATLQEAVRRIAVANERLGLGVPVAPVAEPPADIVA